MNELNEKEEQERWHYRQHTRLRDFGAFKSDMSALPTYQMPAVSIDGVTTGEIMRSQQPGDGGKGAAIIPFPGPYTEPLKTSLEPVKLVRVLETGHGQEEQEEQMGQVGQEPVSLKQAKRKKQLSVALRIGVTIVLFVFLFKSFSWSTMLQAFRHIHYGEMLIGVIVGLFGVFISCYQWRSLLGSEQISYDLAELIDLYFVGIAFSHFLPTGMGGDVVKAIHVGRKANNSAGSASAVLMCRITGFMGMLSISIPTLLIKYRQFNGTVVLWFSLLSLAVGGMLIGAMLAAIALPRFLKGKWLTHRLLSPVMKIGNALKESMKRPVALAIAVLYGAVFWVGSCLNYYAYGIGLDIHASLYFYLVAIPFVSLVTFLPISINGFGLREGAFVYIFSTIHAPAGSALLLALFMDAQALLFGVVGGYIYLRMGAKRGVARSAKQQHVA